MSRRVLFVLLSLLLAGAARGVVDQARVVDVHFQHASFPGSNAQWLLIDCELDARPADRHLTGHAQVTLQIGYQVPGEAGKPRRWEFYQSVCTLVGLRNGRTRVRFFLPPEIVQRDRLAGELAYWRLQVNGASFDPQAPSVAYSASLSNDPVRKSFLDKIQAESGSNRGELRPQYQTPWLAEWPNQTPAYIY